MSKHLERPESVEVLPPFVSEVTERFDPIQDLTVRFQTLLNFDELDTRCMCKTRPFTNNDSQLQLNYFPFRGRGPEEAQMEGGQEVHVFIKKQQQ